MDRSVEVAPVPVLAAGEDVVALEGARTRGVDEVSVADGALTSAAGVATVAEGERTGAAGVSAVTVGACTVVAGTSAWTGDVGTGTDPGGASTDAVGVVAAGVEVDGSETCPTAGGDVSAVTAVAIPAAMMPRLDIVSEPPQNVCTGK